MPRAAELEENVTHGCLGTLDRLRVDAQALGQLIGGLKANAPDVAARTGKDWHAPARSPCRRKSCKCARPRGAHAMRLQKDHDVAHGLLLPPAFTNLRDAPRADALHLFEKHRTFIDNCQGAGAEDLDNPVRELRPDALD